jgi:hypothetical protein
MKLLNTTDEELQMSDNYFTILSNTYSDVWFDQGVELGGGQPFTVGSEGDERNNRHIVRCSWNLRLCTQRLIRSQIRATQLLESVISSSTNQPNAIGWPYVRRGNLSVNRPSVNRAPCLSSSCLLETSIDLLPDGVEHFALAVDQMLTLEARNMELLTGAQRSHYDNYPPSHAVDGRPGTAFRSPERRVSLQCKFRFTYLSDSDAKEGDTISLDVLRRVGPRWQRVDFVFLVDRSTEEILRASTFQVGLDDHWVYLLPLTEKFRTDNVSTVHCPDNIFLRPGLCEF